MKLSTKNLCSRYLRFSYALVIFALSLLAIFEAPTRLLWMAAILVTEYGHVLALLALLTFLPGWRSTGLGWASVVLALVATVLALTPIMRAVPIRDQLPEQLELAFGPNIDRQARLRSGRQRPLDFSDLFFGVKFPTIESTTLVYDSTKGVNLTMDLYRPKIGKTASPAIVVIHGGAWQTGDSKQLPELNSYLAARGYVVAALTYRLAPRWRYPAPIADIQTGVAFLKQHASEFGLDPTRLVLLGRSAGAHLALQAAYTAYDSAIRGVVAFYAPADLHYGYTHPANPLVIDTQTVLEDFLGGRPDELPDVYFEGSPINHVTASTPPTLLIHGGRDELVSPVQSRRLAVRLTESGVPHVYLKLPWATHGCDFNISGPSGQLILYAVERFIATMTVDSSPYSQKDL